MTTSLLLTLLILSLTVIIPLIIGLISLSVPMFVPEVDETVLSIDYSSPAYKLSPKQAVLALLDAFIEAPITETVCLPEITWLETVCAYMGLRVPTKTPYLVSISH